MPALIVASGNEDTSVKAEYEEYSEDEEIPAEQKKLPTNDVTTPSPYFNEKMEQVFVHLHENITLDCPVKNFNERSHMVVWFFEESPIHTGTSVLLKGYRLVDKFQLAVDNVTLDKTGNYYCTIMPQHVRRQVIVTIGEQPITTTLKPATNTKPSEMLKEQHGGSGQCRHNGHDYLAMTMAFVATLLYRQI